LLFSKKNFKDGCIKVSDFGLARTVSEDKMATTTCGTPGYVAPEILE
jgi:serine/threonine protein kinase